MNPGGVETCNEVDDNCDGTVDEATAVDAPTWYADADGDTFGDLVSTTVACEAPASYVADATDCDDTDGATFPGADETCDEVDDDCDGTIDEDSVDALTWYADLDTDTFGDAAVTTRDCDQPAGYVADATDCDDADLTTFPGADEYCDEADDDCDGTVDEADAVDAASWYADADGDTYGDADVAATACAAPPTYVADATDCDDAADTVFPGAAETCNETDDDCDGTTDEDATDALTWYVDADTDGFGAAGSTAASCTQPSGYVADATDCDDADVTAFPGAAETCDEVDDDCDGTVDEDPTDGTTFYADVDGDGYGDTSVSGAYCDLPAGYAAVDGDCETSQADDYPGAPELCDGRDNDCDGTVDDDAGTAWYADADEDGYGDPDDVEIACEAPEMFVADDQDCDDTDNGVSPAATEICENGIDENCSGDASDCAPSGTDALATSADLVLNGTTSTDYVGTSTLIGDFDGDGNADLIVGSNGYDTSGSLQNMGRMYVFYGPISSGATLATADATLTGAKSSGDNAGTALAVAGDVDGDGDDDLMVGAHLVNGSATDAGAAYLVSGPISTGSISPTAGVTTAFNGSVAADYVGYSVAGAGDVNGDGLDDVLVGATQYDAPGATESGGAGLWYGGGTTASETFSAADVFFSGNYEDQGTGRSVAGAGDVDGDGYADFLVGAPDNSVTSVAEGSVWLVYGPPSSTALDPSTADAAVNGAAVQDAFGWSLAGLGDVDGDGGDDFAVGAPYVDAAGTNSGAVYVFTTAPSGTVSASSADVIVTGVTAYDYTGTDVSVAGDVNGDLAVDLLFAVHGYDGGGSSGTGGLCLVYGPLVSGTVSERCDGLWYGASGDGGSFSSNSASSLSGGGDIDADGYDDFVYGLTDADPAGVNRAGTAWLFYGSGE